MKNTAIINLDKYDDLKTNSDDFYKFYYTLSFDNSKVTVNGEKILKLLNDRYHKGEKVFKEIEIQ